MEVITHQIGINLKVERVRRGLSQQELAERSGVSTNTIGKIERGQRSPRAVTLERLANAIGVPLARLIHPDQSEVCPPQGRGQGPETKR